MRNLENPSPDWAEARREYENSDISNRALAQKIGISEKTVRNRVKAEGWVRGAAQSPQTAADADRSADGAEDQANPEKAIERVTGTLTVLAAELDTAVRSLRLFQELAEASLDDVSEKAAKHRRELIARVLTLPTLVHMAERLTAAIARIADAGPGKKERA